MLNNIFGRFKSNNHRTRDEGPASIEEKLSNNAANGNYMIDLNNLPTKCFQISRSTNSNRYLEQEECNDKHKSRPYLLRRLKRKLKKIY